MSCVRPNFNYFTRVTTSVYVIIAIQLRGLEFLKVNSISLSNSSLSTKSKFYYRVHQTDTIPYFEIDGYKILHFVDRASCYDSW
jgi:hypothetical protein